MFSSVSPSYLSMFGSLCLVLVVVESYFRRTNQTSRYRPSNLIEELAERCRSVFRWIGFQIARLTDLYYWIKEYFPYEDICRLVKVTSDLVVSPFWAIKGWYSYYSASMSNVQFGVLTSILVICGLMIVGYCAVLRYGSDQVISYLPSLSIPVLNKYDYYRYEYFWLFCISFLSLCVLGFFQFLYDRLNSDFF